MRHDPVLAAVTIPAGRDGYKAPRVFRVEGGLHHISGNSAPHFSLTYTEHREDFPDQIYSCGAGHAEILRRFPQFADLAALHLSGIDGVPMHAEANGWYWLAGALGGMGERYHGGNAGQDNSAADCLQVFADHCRISTAEALSIADKCKAATAARDAWRAVMETMRPRWKAEADAAIAKHGLRVYGDPWPVAA